jgi:hypothetical protein
MNTREATYLRLVFGGVCAWPASIALLHRVPMAIRFDSRFTAPIASPPAPLEVDLQWH